MQIDGAIGKKGKKEALISRPFLDMCSAEKDEPSQQSSEGKLPESKGMVDLMECKTQKICSSRDIVQLDTDKPDSGRDSAKSGRDRETSEWLSNKVTRLSSFRDADQASETMSMIKKARVSVRTRSESSMVGI